MEQGDPWEFVPLAGSRQIPVIVDDRESRGALLGELRGCLQIDVTVERLPVGDYLVDNRFLFERKTLPDLVGSVIAGRLFSQALRLAEVADYRPALILEGTAKDLRGSRMRWEAVQGALVTVSLLIGLPVLRTRSAQETVRTFQFAALQARSVAVGALPRRGKRPRGKKALQSHLLQGLPGVGPERAARLLERFGSVEAVLSADRKALELVPGIGTQTARAMRWAVEEEGGSYGFAKET